MITMLENRETFHRIYEGLLEDTTWAIEWSQADGEFGLWIAINQRFIT